MATGRIGKAMMAIGVAMIAAAAAMGIAVIMMDGAAAHPEADPKGTVPEGSENPIDWDYWLSVNPDIVGWVRVPGTEIDQPIVQARKDAPRHYLTHDVHGNWNLWGVPYIDAECERGIDSWNVVVYGHNMSYPPAMFHDFEKYADEGYAREHLAIELYTPDSVRRLRVAGSDTVNGWDDVKRTAFSGAADYWDYRQERLAACDVRLEHAEEFGQMFTFCTCSYYFNPSDERTLVYAL